MRLLILMAWLVIGSGFGSDAQAQEGSGDLATAATNPIGSANQLQFQNTFIPESENSDGYSNIGVIQPVLSFELPKGGYFEGLVTRITLPIISTPEVLGDRDTGTGDTTALIIPTHTNPGAKPGEFFTWGPIAAVGIPTASEDRTGAGLWSLGPGIIGLTNLTYDNGNSLMLGGLGYHQWDIEGEDLNTTSGFPVVIYKFGTLFGQEGWYVRAPDDLWQYNWTSEEFTQIPVGAFAGRAFQMGKQPVNVYMGGWYNAADPDDGTAADYAIKTSFSLVFPK